MDSRIRELERKMDSDPNVADFIKLRRLSIRLDLKSSSAPLLKYFRVGNFDGTISDFTDYYYYCFICHCRNEVAYYKRDRDEALNTYHHKAMDISYFCSEEENIVHFSNGCFYKDGYVLLALGKGSNEFHLFDESKELSKLNIKVELKKIRDYRSRESQDR